MQHRVTDRHGKAVQSPARPDVAIAHNVPKWAAYSKFVFSLVQLQRDFMARKGLIVDLVPYAAVALQFIQNGVNVGTYGWD